MAQHKCLSLLLLAVVMMAGSCWGQENAQRRVPQSLIECYEEPELLNRDNRLPMTMNMLIDLIRRIENTPGFTTDMRQVALNLIHRFRLDGIERNVRVVAQDGVLPFSPSGMQFKKHRVLLSRLLPGNALTFPNNTLTAAERCSLHSMLSSSFERRIRNDEGQRCNQLAQYRYSDRVPREIRLDRYPQSKFGRMEFNDDPENEVPVEGDEEGAEPEAEADPAAEPEGGEEIEIVQDDNTEQSNSQTDIPANQLSACPVENGVVRTTWGAVSAGAVIAGIAAGLEQQTVSIRDLVQFGGSGFARQTNNLNVNNMWAATLAGDLAEVAILQGPETNAALRVGAPGGWNSTAVPRWYFISQNTNLQMTDPEIRGGIDGLVLGTYMQQWRSQASTLRLSQLLEMYYSQRGVFDRDVRACNRNNNFASVAQLPTMQAQAASFSILLEEYSDTPTMQQSAMVNFANNAALQLSNYVPTLTDVACDVTAANVNNFDTIFRPVSADIYIYVDLSWSYIDIQPVVANILDNINVNELGTRVTLLNGNGVTIVNTTTSMSDFHAGWNITTHQAGGAGFGFSNILASMRERTRALMEEERRNSSISLRSKIVLVVANTAGVSDGDTTYAVQQMQIFREEVPDMRLLFLAGGTVTRFSRFVQDSQRDLFTVRTGGGVADSSIATTTTPVIQRIQQAPRRIINPRCGSDWQSSERGSNQANGHTTPDGIVFFSIHPNYFFHSTENNRRVRIQGINRGSLTVCESREIENPRLNATQMGGIACRQIISDSYDIDLRNVCNGIDFIHQCRPIYISVQGSAPTTAGVNIICNDSECQFADGQRFTIVTENFDCFSGVGRIVATLLPVILSAFFFVNRFI